MNLFKRQRGGQMKMEATKTPDKFAGAISVTPTLVRGGKGYHIWVGLPIVENACPQCGQAVNAQSNQFELEGEPNFKEGTLPGGVRCSQCQEVFNETTCYFHDDFELAPATFLALCILTDEDPSLVLNRGFLPSKMPQEGVLVAEGARIGREVRFAPPVLINKGSTIADRCEIGPFVYLENAKIEKKGIRLEYCDVRRSTLNRDASGCTLYDSFIG